MTVNAVRPVSGPHIADGTNRNWSYNFKIFEVDHMALFVTDADGSNGVIVTTGFTIAPAGLDNDNGGTVVYPVSPVAALVSGKRVVPYRVAPFDQSQRIGNQGAYFPETHERALDDLAMQVQQIEEAGNRAVKVDLGQTPLSATEFLLNMDSVADTIAASAAAAAADAAQTDLDRIAVAGDKATVAADKGIVAADKAKVAADKGIVAADKGVVAADKAIVAADKAIVLGYRNEVEADRVEVAANTAAAAGSASAAATALTQTQAARDATLAAFDSFDDRYLGAKAVPPTVDNDGDPLQAGMLYYDTVTGAMKIYNGTIWVAAYVSGGDFAAIANNGSEYDAAQFRTNLSLYSKAEVDGFTLKLTGNQSVSGTKTFSSAPVVPDGSWSLSKLVNAAALSILGRASNSAGARADIAAGTDGHVLRRSGTTIGFGTILSAAISDLAATISNAIASAIGVSVQAYDAQLTSIIPQNSKSAAYTLLLTDAQKHIFHPAADTTARIWTIPANSSVAYPLGTAITFINQNAAGVITIAITTDVMRLAGAGTTGSRTLAANGIATAVKLTATEWIISGTGLT